MRCGRCSKSSGGNPREDRAGLRPRLRLSVILIWAFNGERADCDVPRIPGATEQEIACEAHERAPVPFDTWIASAAAC